MSTLGQHRTIVHIPDDALLVFGYVRREGYRQFLKRIEDGAVQGASDPDMAVIAMIWLSGQIDGKPNVSKAEEWALPAANNGYPYAEWVMAFIELERENVPKMIVWLEKSADQNFAPAQYELGRIHAMGIGYPRDFEQAKRYLRNSRKLGSIMAIPALGKIYYKYGESTAQRFGGSLLIGVGMIYTFLYSKFKARSVKLLGYAPLMAKVREIYS